MPTTRSRSTLNLRHLSVFRAVAHRGGINAAARAIFMSQPAVTQAIAAVERHFGAPLFDRKPSGVALNAAGRLCLLRIERALAELRSGPSDTVRRTLLPRLSARGLTVAQLEALIAVVEHGGFGAASRALGIARPTLHRSARGLERAVGTPLFERTSLGINATREARRLARHARLAFSEIAQAHAELAALGGKDVGRTAIGLLPLARSFLVPKAILAFTASHPSHSIELLDGSYESLLAALRSGAADMLVGALRKPAPSADVIEELLFEDALALVVRAGHPLTLDPGPPSVQSLARYPWIAPRPGSPLRRQFDDLFAGGMPRGGLIDCNSLEAARALLLASDRVMLLSARQIQYELDAGLLVALAHPAGQVMRSIGLTVRREWHPTRAQHELLHLLRAAGEKLSPGSSTAHGDVPERELRGPRD